MLIAVFITEMVILHKYVYLLLLFFFHLNMNGDISATDSQVRTTLYNIINSDTGKYYFEYGDGPGGGRGLLPIMDYTGRLRPKGVPFSGWRYIKG